jgi:hypothetical protein
MPTVDYLYSQNYLPIQPSGPLGPALKVDLIMGNARIPVIGVLDSGSTVTVFNPEYAELLGIEDVRAGEMARVGTQGGPVSYYLFDLEMEVQLVAHVLRFPCRVGFFEARKPRNILGRDFLFRHYQIGFRDREQEVYLRPED